MNTQTFEPSPHRLAIVLTTAVVLAIVSPAMAPAAIVNSLRAFADEKAGWAGALDASYGAGGGNTDQTALAASARVQWRGDRDRLRLLGASRRITTEGVETARSVLGHLRHNRTLSGPWSTLAFVQLQENPFQRLKLRTLVGFGVRWEAAHTESRTLSFGAAHMFEREQLTGEDGHTKKTRLSSFVSLLFEVREGVDLDLSAFYQPDWSDFGDWRTFARADLGVDVAGPVELFMSWTVEHDARPPVGVEKTDWETGTGIRVKF